MSEAMNSSQDYFGYDIDDSDLPLGATPDVLPFKEDRKPTLALGATPDFVPLKKEISPSSSMAQEFLSLSCNSSIPKNNPNRGSTPDNSSKFRNSFQGSAKLQTTPVNSSVSENTSEFSPSFGNLSQFSPSLGSTPAFNPRLCSTPGYYSKIGSTPQFDSNPEDSPDISLRFESPLQLGSTPDYMLPKRLNYTDSRPRGRGRQPTWKRFSPSQWNSDSSNSKHQKNESGNLTMFNASTSSESGIDDYIHPSMWENPWRDLEKQLEEKSTSGGCEPSVASESQITSSSDCQISESPDFRPTDSSDCQPVSSSDCQPSESPDCLQLSESAPG